jgi:large subunit ribosomal protein L3
MIPKATKLAKAPGRFDSMPAFLLGRKIGMTRLYDKAGNNVPVTVIQAGPCQVSQIKTTAPGSAPGSAAKSANGGKSDGYDAIQLAFEDVKPRNSTFPLIGHDNKAGLPPKRFHREVRVSAEELGQYVLGQSLTVQVFENVKFVDVVGTSKGKGFAGVMKRHNFKGFPASHGTERKHRAPGSACGRASNRGTGKPKKGIRMSGRMGGERVTVRSLPIVAVDKEKNLIMVKGPVPGANKGLVLIKEAGRLYKAKARQLAEAS